MGKMVLEIKDIAPDRDTIEINGKSYELMQMGDFSLRQSADVRRLGDGVLAGIGEMSKLTPEKAGQLEDLLNSLIMLILKGIGPEAVEKLSFKNKNAIIMVFWKAAIEQNREKAAEAQTSPEIQTGATSSQDSVGTTEAIQ